MVSVAPLVMLNCAVPPTVNWPPLIFSFATIPAFVIVDVLLPLTSGFPMFALIVAPMLFGCAYLMSKPNPKTMLMGYLSALLFASVGEFHDAIHAALARGGNILIPTFALGRTQEILALLAMLTRSGKLRPQPIYIGGLSSKISEIYDRCAQVGRRP